MANRFEPDFLKFSLMFLKFVYGANIMQVFNNYTLIVLPIHLFLTIWYSSRFQDLKTNPMTIYMQLLCKYLILFLKIKHLKVKLFHYVETAYLTL